MKIPDNVPIAKHNKLTCYDAETKKRSEMIVLNSCYHIAHGKKFTEFFSNANLPRNGFAFVYGNDKLEGKNQTSGKDKDKNDEN